MNVFDAINKRRSTRGFLDKEIAASDLEQILQAARLAPSANNLQEWRFVVVRDYSVKDKVSQASKGQVFLSQASVIIACCAQTDGRLMTCGQIAYPINLAIAIDHMTLAAIELGIDSCWIGAFYEEKVKKVLSIPREIRVVQLLALGYAQSEPKTIRQRLDLDQITYLDRWGQRR